ncbi:hypothetical protein [Pseudohoeflea coraliihabitans]|uniref:Uncharacterized protein n=1 Tax=Pseudohoeflea coraliihabitans TaxID=2860393 RepID=A0ABS6WRT4_9HYPH|nr:hypothetical protein [Pseudohoeflea sp. DP4N28-3]MBW3098653.1 hypothetical protein [Pseudohoeflea sp. DP4N28-3]
MNGLEARVASLEAYTDAIRSDVAAIKPDVKDSRERLVRIEERVSALPTKGYINTAVVGAITLIGAFIAFQAQIQAFFGTLPQ